MLQKGARGDGQFSGAIAFPSAEAPGNFISCKTWLQDLTASDRKQARPRERLISAWPHCAGQSGTSRKVREVENLAILAYHAII